MLLTAIAVIDDLGAIIVIALFYTAQLAVVPLLAAAGGLLLLFILNRSGVRVLWPYLLVGALVWICVLLSGIHATLAGVATAAFIPLAKVKGRPDDVASPLHRLEHGLHPVVAFAIVPLFGFANAGVSFAGMAPAALTGAVPLGILLGLIVGKQVGVFGACAALIRLRVAKLPAGASWRQLYGMAMSCGIGFTMSLFIGALAFGDEGTAMNEVKVGVLAGSIISAALAYLLLRLPKRPRVSVRV